MDTMAAKMSERILAAVHMAERMKGVEMQTNRTASELESEKATRARESDRIWNTLEGVKLSIHGLTKSNWTAAGAIGAAFVLWDIAKHFIKF
jgi:hypothetical protein